MEEMARIYGFENYWWVRQRIKGNPTIEYRTSVDENDGRLNYWIDLIDRYGPPPGSQVLEVGCAHGALLAALNRKGYVCVGVEPDSRTADWTREKTGLDVRAGFFPDVSLPKVELFLAMDVIEHSSDPLNFMRGVRDILISGGVAILQTPIDRYDYKPPFGELFSSAFDDLEHLFIFTNRSIARLAELTGLEVIENRERLWLHHEVVVLKKP
jgi:2-polyprenyl-3-methyl-5-hydroxy-6-metoxy-1,4-benzoquinol methylase